MLFETFIDWATTVINFLMLLQSFLGINFFNLG